MKIILSLLLILFVGIAPASIAQKGLQTQKEAQAVWQEFLVKKNILSSSSPSSFTFLEEVAKQRASSKKQASTGAARYAPEWCYASGTIETLDNGVRSYFLEQYTYTSPNNFTIIINQVSATGQFLAEARRGTGSVSPEDTLVMQMQEKIQGQWKNQLYFKGIYNEASSIFQPVLVKEYEHHLGPQKLGTEITTYKFHFNHPQQLSYEIALEDEGEEAGVPYFVGVKIKNYANGAFISHRAAQKDTWEDDEKREVTQENGKKVITHYLSMGAGQWVPVTQFETTYNAQGKATEEIIKENDGTNMKNALRFLSTFVGDNLTTKEIYTADVDNPSTWNLATRKTFTYTPANQLETTLEKASIFFGEPLSDIKKEAFSYYGQGHAFAGKLEKEEVFVPDALGGWIPQSRKNFSYTADGKYTSYRAEAYTSQWMTTKLVQHEINTHNMHVLNSEIDYENNAEKKAEIKTMSYINCSNVMSVEDERKNENKPTVAAYPNPFNDTFTLQIEVPKSTVATVNILTIQGKVVKSVTNQKLSQGKQELQIDAAHLPSGIYVCQVQTPEGVQALRILKQ